MRRSGRSARLNAQAVEAFRVDGERHPRFRCRCATAEKCAPCWLYAQTGCTPELASMILEYHRDTRWASVKAADYFDSYGQLPKVPIRWLLNQRWASYGTISRDRRYVVLNAKGWTGVAYLADAVNRFNVFVDYHDPVRATENRIKVVDYVLAKNFT